MTNDELNLEELENVHAGYQNNEGINKIETLRLQLIATGQLNDKIELILEEARNRALANDDSYKDLLEDIFHSRKTR